MTGLGLLPCKLTPKPISSIANPCCRLKSRVSVAPAIGIWGLSSDPGPLARPAVLPQRRPAIFAKCLVPPPVTVAAPPVPVAAPITRRERLVQVRGTLTAIKSGLKANAVELHALAQALEEGTSAAQH
jgi:hypothetical protein